MIRPSLLRAFGAGALAVLVGACPEPTAPVAVPTTLALSHNALSFDAIGATEQIRATVRDQNGQEMAAVPVSWASSSGSVMVTAAASPPRVPSDGARPAVIGGSVVLTAAAAGPATITATAGTLQASFGVQVSQIPVAPVKVAGDLQTGTVGTALPISLRVKIEDRLGAAIANAPVRFSVTQGTGSLSNGLVQSGSDGMAETAWVLGAGAGSAHEVTVTADNGPGSATFTATARAGPAAALGANGGEGQTAVVGGLVAVAPSVIVRDGFNNPVAGVPVTFSPGSGGGSITGASAVSNSGGVATVGSWRVGTVPGPNTLIAAVAGLAPVSFAATALVGPPAGLATQAGQGQSGAIGSAVPIAPAVRVTDQFGNPVPGVAATFAVTGGGGAVTGGTAITDGNGVAAVGSWTLGPLPGPNTLAATLPGLAPVQFGAIGIAPPATVAVFAGDNQTAPVGTAVPIPPSVRVTDAFGNPLEGVMVVFAVTGGGGSRTGGSPVTTSNGVATVGSWTLGPVAGPNTLSATVAGLPPALFSATGVGISGVPASIAVNGGNAQAALPGSAVATAPSVMVRGAAGEPVAGVTVTFAVTGGSGSVAGATAVTDAGGIARVGSWMVGTGANCLAASIAEGGIAGNPVSFVATGIPAGDPGYDVHVQYLSCITPAQEAAFANAAARWGTVITGDLADLVVTLGPGSCGANAPALASRPIDDLLIFATVEPIDGTGGILGSAGPCFIRTAGNLSIIGRMRFDVADIATLQANGQLTNVILHEMGHVIGIGTLWSLFGQLQSPSPVGGPPVDTFHSGPNALIGFNAIGGSTYTGGNKVPVENMFGPGTINSHWRESVLANELMTGFISSSMANPLSELTVRSLQDFGYEVDPAGADPFFLTLALRAEGPPESTIHLENDILPLPLYRIDRNGRITRVR